MAKKTKRAPQAKSTKTQPTVSDAPMTMHQYKMLTLAHDREIGNLTMRLKVAEEAVKLMTLTSSAIHKDLREDQASNTNSFNRASDWLKKHDSAISDLDAKIAMQSQAGHKLAQQLNAYVEQHMAEIREVCEQVQARCDANLKAWRETAARLDEQQSLDDQGRQQVERAAGYALATALEALADLAKAIRTQTDQPRGGEESQGVK